MYSDEWRTFVEAYKKCLTKPFSHLLCDTHPQSLARYRIRSNIFAENETILPVGTYLQAHV